MHPATDAKDRADVLIGNLKKPRPDRFETPWWQFFYATCAATALLIEDPEAVEAAFIQHPEYDAAIASPCAWATGLRRKTSAKRRGCRYR